MLDQTDLLKLEEIVDRKTSDIRQDVSILKQDVSGLKQDIAVVKVDVSELKTELKVLDDKVQRQGVLLDENTRLLQLVYEKVSETNEKISDYSVLKDRVNDNHEKRITRLETAFKKKLA